MFTGIVQAVGRVRSLENGRLVIDAPPSFRPTELGESVAVNGCCLTAIELSDGLHFELSEETLARTALATLAPRSLVNLERAATLATLFGGHIVQGHVDCTGTLVAVTPQEGSTVYAFQAPVEYDRYLIDKGSITVDGVSLTVVEPHAGRFDTWLIPHTLQNTHLHSLSPGARVNLEFDVIAKHVEKLLTQRKSNH